MKVLHVLPTRDPAYGGPLGVVEAYATRLKALGDDVTVYPDPVADARWWPGFWPGLRAIKRLADLIEAVDLVHVHGLWTIPTSAAALCARRWRVPYVATLHGMIDPWTLRRSALKKRAYRALIEERTVSGASAIHVLSSRELESARRFGIQTPCFVLPNGADCRALANLPPRSELEAMFPVLAGRTVVLFLGRLHPKKGLRLLLPAFARALRTAPHLHLVIAGPDEGGHEADLRADVSRLDVEDRVTFTGAVAGAVKATLLGGADLFVLTSHQEGDSLAVKEALAAGLATLISEPCELGPLRASGAAFVCKQDEASIADALERLAADPARRAELGAAGRLLMKQCYDWDVLASRLRAVYLDLLHGTRKALVWADP